MANKFTIRKKSPPKKVNRVLHPVTNMQMGIQVAPPPPLAASAAGAAPLLSRWGDKGHNTFLGAMFPPKTPE
jgi:hypothetical protein